MDTTPRIDLTPEARFFLAPDQRDLTDQYVTGLQRSIVADCGHWIQQERPREVNSILVDWLTTRVH